MDFEDALERTQRLERVGELRLRYETSLLIAEPPPAPRDLKRQLVRFAGVAMMLLAVGTLLLSPAGTAPWSAFAIAVVGSVLFLAGERLFPEPARRRFVLNFATESLRIDDLPPHPRTRVLPFDDITALDVVPDGSGRFALRLSARGAAATELLVRAVSADDVEQLRRLWRLLCDAFGIRRAGAGPSDLQDP